MEDKVTQLKKDLMALNTAELLHVINYIQKERDEILLAVSFTNSFFTMDIPHFKEFKAWLQGDSGVDLSDMISETILQVASEIGRPVDINCSNQSSRPATPLPQSDEHPPASQRGHNGPPPSVAAGGGY